MDQPSTGGANPSYENERSGMEESNDAPSNTERDKSKLVSAQIEAPKPSQENPCKDNVLSKVLKSQINGTSSSQANDLKEDKLPMAEESRVEIALPKRPKLRSKVDSPRQL